MTKKLRRHIVLALVAVYIIASMTPFVVAADNPLLKTANGEVNKIAVEVLQGNATFESDAGKYTITALDEEGSKDETTGSGCNATTTTVTTYTSQTTIVTFTNNHDGTATIVGYALGTGYDSVDMSNCVVEGGNLIMEKGGSFRISITSTGSDTTAGSKTVALSFTDIVLETKTRTISFASVSNATLTVVADGNTVTNLDAVEASNLKITAAPASGYKVYRWEFVKNSDGSLTVIGGSTNSIEFNPEEDGTITCVVITDGIPSDAATYIVNNVTDVTYRYLDEAIAAVGTDYGTIEITKSGTVYGSEGQASFTIPSNVTLVLPYASGKEEILSESLSSTDYFPYGNYTQNCVNNNYQSNPTARDTSRTYLLTIPKGTTVNNNGIIAVGGTLHGNAALNGAHSNLQVNGTLNLTSSTSVLSAIGYVYGDGSVVANGSGAKILQPFSLLRIGSSSWHIGAAGRAINDYTGMKSWPDDGYNGTNPSPRYATQAIQCTLTMKYGDYMYGYAEQHAYDTCNMSTVILVGKNTDSSCLIGLKNGATLTSTYNSDKCSTSFGNVGKLTLTISGGAVQGTLSLKLSIGSITLTKWPFPVPYNYDLVLTKGTYDLKYDLSLLPGAGLTVASGATLNIPSGVSLAVFNGAYDHSSWGRANQSAAFTISKGSKDPEAYPLNSTFENFVAPDGTTESTMANLVVNGTMNVYGSFGGIVQSTGTGTIVMDAGASVSRFTRQLGLTGQAKEGMFSSSTYDFAGATIYEFYPQYYDANGKLQTMVAGKTYKAANSTGNTGIKYSCDLYTNSRDFSAVTEIEEDITATAVGQWYNYTVSFDANGGEGTMDELKVISDVAATLTANTFTRTGYGFTGWNTKADGSGTAYDDGAEITVSADTTLYAQWEQTAITVTLVYGNGTADATITVEPGGTYSNLPTETPTPAPEGTPCFQGWFTASEGGDKITATSTVNADITTLYAHWAAHTPGAAATCTTAQTCTVCNAQMEAAKGHSPVAHAATNSTCTVQGNSAYWSCENCDKYFSDEACTTEIANDSWKLPLSNHSYGEGQVTTAPSCTETGVMTYECTNCEHTKTEVMANTGHTPGDAATCTTPQTCTGCGAEITAALGHDAVADEAVDPTCTETGLTAGSHCKTCGEVLVAQTRVDATGHSYEAVVTAPTCTEEGFTTYTCNDCGDSYVADKVAATDHSYDTGVVTPPTCTEQGYTTYTCACGVSYKDNFVDATSHSYTEEVIAPTCKEQGYTKYTCACGHTYNDNYVAKAEHTWNDGEVTTVPDCDSEGVKTYTCTECGETKTETIAATGHSWNDGEVTTAPDCDSEGVMTYTCTECGETKTEAIGATGHTPEDVARVDPTCTQPGKEAGKQCSVCGSVLEGMGEIPATGHSYNKVVTAPTCTAGGYTTYTCSCGDSYVADEVAAKGHSYTSKVTDPTCTEEGFTTYTCSVCSDTYTDDVVAATGHSYEEEVTKPTCEAQGYTTHTCSACGDSYVDSYTNPTGHSYTDYVSDGNATCTKDGTKTAVCDNGCGEKNTILDTGSAIGHKYEQNKASGSLFADATCTTKARYYIACDVCGTPHEQETVEVGEPLGHDLEKHAAKDPTCTEIGWNEYETCKRCDYTSYVEIAALGHTNGTPVVENNVAPDCNTAGSYDTVVYCTICGTEVSRETTVVPATGHTEGEVVVENNVAPDCVNGGSYDNVVYCTVCDTELSRDTITVDALGHTEGDVVVENNVDATCTANGSYDNVVYCTVCDVELSRETITVDALGHDYGAVVTAPTCTTAGYTTYTCGNCGDSYVADETAATGHSHSESITTAATCTTPGVKTYACACGDSYTEEIAATGHENTTTTTVDATCVAEGSVTVTCDDCGTTISTESIPATGEHTYADGVCTGCGAVEEVDDPITIAHSMQASLTLKAEVFMNVSFKLENLGDVDPVSLENRVGLLIWNTSEFPGADIATIENCNYVIESATYKESDLKYTARTLGIPAKNLGDSLTFRAYYLNDDGEYVYGRIISDYSPKTYCYKMLRDDETDDDALMIAILNYCTAAQEYFAKYDSSYSIDQYINEDLTDAQKQLNWNSGLVRSDWSVPAEKEGELTRDKNILTYRGASLTLAGAIDYNFSFKVSKNIQVRSAEILTWTEAMYNAATVLTEENATVYDLVFDSSEANADKYTYKYAGLPAKDMFSPIYACAKITDVNGDVYYSGVIPYCPERFAYINATNEIEVDANLAKWLVIYGAAARNLFA